MATVSQKVRHALRPNEEFDKAGFDEREQRRRSEPSEALEFVPLSADVAPQLTLFGAPPAVASAAARQRVPFPPAPDPAPPTDLPAFERRTMLRSERHRLVSELQRRDGSSHREINTWLNRKLGIATVEDATVDELQRSVELLATRLTSRR
jgi:hypothetical protein